MSSHALDQDSTNPEPGLEPRVRPVGGTEYSWCRAVPVGTGITVLSVLLSKSPDIPLIQSAIHKLIVYHPILRSKLRFSSSTNSFSYIIPPTPQQHLIQIQPFDLSSTSAIISSNNDQNPPSITPCHLILEHELNKNSWSSFVQSSDVNEIDVFYTSLYTIGDGRWALMLRLHTSVCDRVSAVALLRELLGMVGSGCGGGGTEGESENEGEVSLAIEEYVPTSKSHKPFWARGMDVLGYSLNSFRLSNLEFVDADSLRYTRVVRLLMDADDTKKLLDGCKSRGIKLCGALAAAGLIAARSSKNLPDHQTEKYAVVTLIDCRSILDPVLSSSHIGFYHSAILNTHDISGGEELWELAKRSFIAFANAKNNNKHFSDMGDLNFLMCKAIENPGLTPSSSMRTASISVFEDPVIDESNPMHGELGVNDYVGCASVHGVGPSIAIFDTIRDGRLDCACAYPSPLHSREQMQKLIDDMKSILVDGCAEEVT